MGPIFWFIIGLNEPGDVVLPNSIARKYQKSLKPLKAVGHELDFVLITLLLYAGVFGLNKFIMVYLFFVSNFSS